MLKEKLDQLKQALADLKTKLQTKLTEKDQTITQIKTEKQQTVTQLETALKEQKEDEKVLEQLLKEFQELSQSL
jgi:hypothetical protein